MTAEEFDARVKAELDKIRARLKLTPEQQTQLKALLTEEVDRMDALAYRYEGEARTVLTDSRAKMRNVLTPKQQTEWDKIKVEYREQIRAKAEGKPASSKS
jgi:Spy/CpxP family protein refolding chaperone